MQVHQLGYFPWKKKGKIESEIRLQVRTITQSKLYITESYAKRLSDRKSKCQKNVEKQQLDQNLWVIEINKNYQFSFLENAHPRKNPPLNLKTLQISSTSKLIALLKSS